MGLDAYVDAANLFVKIGSYGWYHSFRAMVCDKLEDGEWGSRFPRLMNHSDCDGTYSPDEAAELLDELQIIKKELENVKYPVLFYCDAGGKVIDYRAKYSDSGTFVYANGLEFGVVEDGLVIQSDDPARVALPADLKWDVMLKRPQYRWYFASMERVDSDTWVCRRHDDSSVIVEGLFTDAPPECTTIRAGEMLATEVFGGIIDRLERLCKASIETGDPIVFC